MQNHHAKQLAIRQSPTLKILPDRHLRKHDCSRGSTLSITGRSELRIDHQGDRVGLRIWTASAGQMFPSRDGFSIPADMLPALVAALAEIGGVS